MTAMCCSALPMSASSSWCRGPKASTSQPSPLLHTRLSRRSYPVPSGACNLGSPPFWQILHRSRGQPASGLQQQRRQRRHVLPPLRVTNTSSEVFKAVGVDVEDFDNDIVFDDNYEVHNPDLGPLSARVGRFYLDGLLNNEVDLEETAYWFSTPPEGWNQKVQRMKPAEVVPVTFPEPYHEDAAAENRVSKAVVLKDARARTALEDLHEGQVFTGLITDVWLYHGAQIDIGAEFDGLVAIPQEDWLEGGQLPEAELAKLEAEAMQAGNAARMAVIVAAAAEAKARHGSTLLAEMRSEALRVHEAAAAAAQAAQAASPGTPQQQELLKKAAELAQASQDLARSLVEYENPQSQAASDVMLLLTDMERDALMHKAEAAYAAAVQKFRPLTVIEGFLPGMEVQVRVHKVRQPGLYRWPLQLSVIREDVQAMIAHPDDYEPSINHGWAVDQGWDIQDILDATGRKYEPSTYFLPPDDEFVTSETQKAFGWGSPDTGHYEYNPLERAWIEDDQAAIASAASQAMATMQ